MGALEDAQKQAEEMMKQAQAQAGASGAGAANLAAAQADVAAAKQQSADLDRLQAAASAISSSLRPARPDRDDGRTPGCRCSAS